MQQIAVRRVDLDDLRAGFARPLSAASANACTTRDFRFIQRLGCYRRREKGIALGAKIGRQPCSDSSTAPPPFQGAAVLALRPACANCIAGRAMLFDEAKNAREHRDMIVQSRCPDPAG
jgi:hypothetical protein